MRTLFLTLGITLALSGCITTEERMAYHRQDCQRMGVRPGSEAMSECVLHLELERRAEYKATQKALLSNMQQTPQITDNMCVMNCVSQGYLYGLCMKQCSY